MKTLAESLVGVAAFLALSGDDVIDRAAAAGILEDIATDLEHASEEERKAILAVCQAKAAELGRTGDAAEREFYATFGAACAGVQRPRGR